MELPPEGRLSVGTLLSAGHDTLKEVLAQLQAAAGNLHLLQQRLDGLSKASKSCHVREATLSQGSSETTAPPSYPDSLAGQKDAPDAVGMPCLRTAGAGAPDTPQGSMSAQKDPEASVMADLAAKYRRELDMLHKSHDAKVQASMELCLRPCESSGAIAEEGQRQLREGFLRLHKEHEACVTELHQKQELRLRQLLPRPTAAQPNFHSAHSGLRPTNSSLGSSPMSSMPTTAGCVTQAASILQLIAPQESSSYRNSVRISSVSCVSALATDRTQGRPESGDGSQNPYSMRQTHSASGRGSTRESIQLLCTKEGLLENFGALLTILNVIWMAVEVDVGMAHIKDGTQKPAFWSTGELVFTVLFCLELVARLGVQRCGFFDAGRRFWNFFNAFIVLADLYDVITRMYSPDFLRSLRVLRSVRALRVMGAVRFVPGLRLMVASIVCSLSAVVWALVFLLLMTFVGSLCLLQSLTVILVEDSAVGTSQNPLIQTYYGSMGSTMMNVILGVTGGIDWEVMMQPLWPQARWCAYLLMLLMIFQIVGVLNVVTSVFVESTHRIHEVDSELAVSEQYHHDMNICKALRAFLSEAAEEGSSTLTKGNFDAMLEAPRCQAMLRTLDLDIWSVRGVFRMLAGSEASVEIEDLVYGLTRLKGNAKAIDMAMLMYEGKRNQAKMATTIVQIEAMLKELSSDLKGCKGSASRREPLTTTTTEFRSLIL